LRQRSEKSRPEEHYELPRPISMESKPKNGRED
jgi:hypothetical protein